MEQWWRWPLIPALGGRGRQISEFEASLVYRVSSRTARVTQRNPASKNQKKKKKKKKKKIKKKKKKKKRTFPFSLKIKKTGIFKSERKKLFNISYGAMSWVVQE